MRFTYPRAQLGRGIGVNALVVATSAAVGPDRRGGDPGGRHLALSVRHQHPARHRRPWRWAGACLPHTDAARAQLRLAERGLSAVTFGLGIAAIDSVGHGETLLLSALPSSRSPPSPASLLVVRQTHMASPLLPVDLLRIPIFALSISTSIASFCGQMLAFVAIPFYLETSSAIRR